MGGGIFCVGGITRFSVTHFEDVFCSFYKLGIRSFHFRPNFESWVVKLRLLLEIILIEIILDSQVARNQKMMTRPCFKHFCRFVTRPLMLRP